MRVLIAPDHFGGTLTAAQAAEVMARPWREGEHDVQTMPMSDGAAGLIETVHAAGGGTLIPVQVPGAWGEPVPAVVLHVPGAGGGSAYLEGGAVLGPPPQMSDHADAAGERAAELATRGSSAGLADLLHAALDTGARRVVIGLGPSPTHDAGAGLLTRLAGLTTGGAVAEAEAETADGAGDTAQPWASLAHQREVLAGVEVLIAAAQDTPLLGLSGAGAGLQKYGLSALQAQQIETRTSDLAHQGLAHARALPPLRRLLSGPAPDPEPGAPHTGAGGGVAFALGLLGARLLPGAHVIAEQIGLRDALEPADLVLTGTRVLDADTLYQGVVEHVGSRAAREGLPVVALAREVYVNDRELAKSGISAAFPLVHQPLLPGNRRPAVEDPAGALARRSARVMRHWART